MVNEQLDVREERVTGRAALDLGYREGRVFLLLREETHSSTIKKTTNF
jgi:hypothetical protein